MILVDINILSARHDDCHNIDNVQTNTDVYTQHSLVEWRKKWSQKNLDICEYEFIQTRYE